MRAKLAFAAVALVAAAAPAAGGSNAVVTPVWLPPVELTPRSDYSIVDQDVAVDPGENLLAVWSGTGGVQARYRAAGGPWQAPVRLAACGSNATVAFDAVGNATVAWLQCTPGFSRVTTAGRHVDGSWTSPVILSTPGRQVGFLHLAVAGSGAAVASWIENDRQVWVVQASVRAPGSDDWGTPAQVSAVGADAEDSSPAVDDTGDAVLGFTRDDAAGALVWSAFKPSGSDWQRAVNLSEPGNYAYAIQVAMRPGGSAVALWDENGEGRLAMRSAATGTWSEQAPFAAYTVGSLVTDSSGDVVASWQYDEMMVSELPAGSDTWQLPVAIPSSQPAVNGFTIGFDGHRGLVAVWARSDTYERGSLVAAHRSAGATAWVSTVTLASVTGFLWNTHAAIGVGGDAVAAFETQNGGSVVTSVLDASAPTLVSLAAPRTGRVGRRLAFAASPNDISAATVQWRFGDGRSATGARVTHVYRKPGRFTVVIVATDAAGHSTAATRPVRISKG